ncbi:MAG: MFS transporter [Chloroflexi bacterium]|nr:MFS transporter [Chloroflexota bacterium]
MVLFASTLVQTSASFGNQMVSPIAPALVDGLRISRSQVGLVTAATYVGGVLTLSAAGWVADRLGVRSMFLVGLLATGAPILLASQTPSFAVLIALMVLSGIGNGISLPPTTRAIAYWFPLRRRGLAMGIKQTGVALAGAIMSLTVPHLTLAFGWRGAMAAIASATMLAGVLSWLAYREHPDADASQSQMRVSGQGPRALLRNRGLVLLSATTLCLGAVQLSLVTYMVLFLGERLGFDVPTAGGFLALAQASGIVARIGWGIVSDTLFGGRRKIVIVIISVMATLSSFGLALVAPGLPTIVLVGLLVMAGLSAVGWNGISMTFVAELAGRQASGSAAGLSLSASYIGIILGPPLFGLLVDATHAYTPAFIAAGCVALVSVITASAIRTTGPTGR